MVGIDQPVGQMMIVDHGVIPIAVMSCAGMGAAVMGSIATMNIAAMTAIIMGTVTDAVAMSVAMVIAMGGRRRSRRSHRS